MSPTIPRRIASISRNTKETKIQLTLSIDGGPLDLLEPNPQFDGYEDIIPPQQIDTHASQITPSQHIWIWTGIGFLDHMLHAWAKHAGWSLRLRSRGDLLSRFVFFTLLENTQRNSLSYIIVNKVFRTQLTTIIQRKIPSSRLAAPSLKLLVPASASPVSAMPTSPSTKLFPAQCLTYPLAPFLSAISASSHP